MSSELDTATRAVKEAGRFLMANFAREHDAVKSEGSSISIAADAQSETIILARIRKEHPSHSILSEERGLDKRGSKFLWIVDPLDGTTNYSRKLPFFNVAIALAKEGELQLACVYNPVLGELFHAELGKGAYLNRKRIHVSAASNLAESRAFLYKGKEMKYKKQFMHLFNDIFPKVRVVRLVSSANLELCYIAAGRFDIMINNGSYAYDYAPGALIAREAGAAVTDFSGKPWSLEQREILASNKHLHQPILKLVKEYHG